MADATDPWDTAALLSGAVLAEEPDLARQLAARLPPLNAGRPVSVTDLLSSRRAFWRRRHGPEPVVPGREQRLEEGRAVHRALGDALAAEGRLEVRLRRDGLAARIDLLADVPVEVKTGASPPERYGATAWPDHLEQLAAYCALTGHPVGRLAYIGPGGGPAPAVTVTELEFRDLRAVRAEFDRRRGLLTAAVSSGNPSALARCRWVDVGCEYRSSGLCDCSGGEPEERDTIVDLVGRQEPRRDIAERWASSFERQAPPVADVPARFRDLIYPRRAYFDRTVGTAAPRARPRGPSEPLDAYERTMSALEEAPVGSVHRLPTHPAAPAEEVLAWDGEPALVRTPHVTGRIDLRELPERFPQYVLELGFRSALTGSPRARLVLGLGSESAPLRVVRASWGTVRERFAEAWAGRWAGLRRAESVRSPDALPACPAWMTRDCPYRDRCGCSAAEGRSHR